MEVPPIACVHSFFTKLVLLIRDYYLLFRGLTLLANRDCFHLSDRQDIIFPIIMQPFILHDLAASYFPRPCSLLFPMILQPLISHDPAASYFP